jgi:cytochrome c-type biogenesis protein CcmE
MDWHLFIFGSSGQKNKANKTDPRVKRQIGGYMKTKYVIGTIIIIAFIIFAGLTLRKSLTPYVSLADAKKTQSTVQVKGVRVNNGHFDMEEETFNFKMADDKGEEFNVVYKGVKPSNFEQATEVVAIGRFQNGTFQAEQLLVKCPSKYEAQGVKS